ncbi:MAG: efflux RND transporter periplasmic adaptor subunit [Desulfobacteraceae bacterium]|nr:MAG: efflux RND transporter periplasmic adaptor subunit [Desulfobacteraceae bacterium]
MKRALLILVVVALASLGAFRAVQVISAKKDEPRKKGIGQIPLVEVAPVTQGLIEDTIVRNGDIAPIYQVTIYSKVQGWLGEVHVREGDLVEVGQVIATLDKREAEAAVAQARASLEAAKARLKQVAATAKETVQSQIRHAKANLELAQVDRERTQALHEKNLVARQKLDEVQMRYNVAKAAFDLAMNSVRKKTWENDIALAEAQVNQSKAALDLHQAQLSNLIIVSPIKGGVTKRFVDPGTMVKDTTRILNLMDLSEMKMVVNVIEREFIHLKKGQPVKITINAFPGRVFTGTIEIVTPALDLQSRTAEIQIYIPNPDLVLKPGMFGRAEITLRSNKQAVIVPIQSVVTELDKDFVFVLQENKAVRREIRKGVVRDTVIEILQGLSPGEQVVTAGQASLKDGSQVRLSLQSSAR